MTDERGDDQVRASWPPDQDLADEEAVETSCGTCGLGWRVHEDLAGGRLRCRCGDWVAVPGSAEGRTAGLLAPGAGQAPLTVAREATPAPRPVVRPAASGGGELRHASVRAQQRWTDRTLLELFLMMVAFIGPQLFIYLAFVGDERAVMQPLGSLMSSVMVFVVAFSSRAYAFQALRWTRPVYFLEAVLATGVFLAFAYGWMALLERLMPSLEMEDPFKALSDQVGIAMVIFMVGVVPGVFEELAFRGLVQARLDALFGVTQSIFVTGAAFALAHGVTLAFPIHMAIGVYLCWLRARSRSLLPGILLHFSYNTALTLESVL